MRTLRIGYGCRFQRPREFCLRVSLGSLANSYRTGSVLYMLKSKYTMVVVFEVYYYTSSWERKLGLPDTVGAACLNTSSPVQHQKNMGVCVFVCFGIGSFYSCGCLGFIVELKLALSLQKSQEWASVAYSFSALSFLFYIPAPAS